MSLTHSAASTQLDKGIASGAIPVKILLEDQNFELFGRLLFCPIVESSDSWGINEYKIYLPADFLRTAAQGKLTAIFAKSNLESGYKAYSWILWLSNSPI